MMTHLQMNDPPSMIFVMFSYLILGIGNFLSNELILSPFNALAFHLHYFRFIEKKMVAWFMTSFGTLRDD